MAAEDAEGEEGRENDADDPLTLSLYIQCINNCGESYGLRFKEQRVDLKEPPVPVVRTPQGPEVMRLEVKPSREVPVDELDPELGRFAVKIDLTKDNDFEKFIYDQPRNYVRKDPPIFDLWVFEKMEETVVEPTEEVVKRESGVWPQEVSWGSKEVIEIRSPSPCPEVDPSIDPVPDPVLIQNHPDVEDMSLCSDVSSEEEEDSFRDKVIPPPKTPPSPWPSSPLTSSPLSSPFTPPPGPRLVRTAIVRPLSPVSVIIPELLAPLAYESEKVSHQSFSSTSLQLCHPLPSSLPSPSPSTSLPPVPLQLLSPDFFLFPPPPLPAIVSSTPPLIPPPPLPPGPPPSRPPPPPSTPPASPPPVVPLPTPAARSPLPPPPATPPPPALSHLPSPSLSPSPPPFPPSSRCYPASYTSSSSAAIFNNKFNFKPKEKSGKGYPTYFERFLATVFSWNPDWAERRTTSFGENSGDPEVRLPGPFQWLQETIASIELKVEYKDYQEFKSIQIPYLLLNALHDINNCLKQLDDKETVKVLLKKVSDYSRKHIKEKPFLSEMKFHHIRSRGKRAKFKQGDLIVVKSNTEQVCYKNMALVVEVESLAEDNGIKRRRLTGAVVDEYVILVKKTVARKIFFYKQMEVQLVANIQTYLIESKAIYDLTSKLYYSPVLLKPSDFINCYDIDKKLKQTWPPLEATLFSERQALGVKVGVNFVIYPVFEWDRILCITCDEYQTKKRIFMEIIKVVVSVSPQSDKLLVIVPQEGYFGWLKELKELPTTLFPVGKDQDIDGSLDKWEDVCLKREDDKGRNVRDLWLERKVVDEIKSWLGKKKEGDISPLAFVKLEETLQRIEEGRLAESRLVVFTLSQLVNKTVLMDGAKFNFKSCLLFDDHLTDSQICSICTLFPVDSLLIVGDRDAGRDLSRPQSFADRLIRNKCHFSVDD